MKKTCFYLALTCSGILCADPINIAFHNGGNTRIAMATRPDGALVMTSVDTWNNPANNGAQTLSFADFVLLDQSGVDSGATLDANAGLSSFNSIPWAENSQDFVMMEGWYGIRDAESITVNNLPSEFTDEGYVVIVYGDVAGSRVMDYVIDGQSRQIDDDAEFAGTFSYGENFMIFPNLTASSFTLTGNTTLGGRSAVNGMRIFPADEAPFGIFSFTTDSLVVPENTDFTLEWAALGATSLTLQPGNIDVTGQSSATVSIAANTTFTLVASDGTNTEERSLDVLTSPEINLFAALPQTARDSADVRLVWDITGSDSLTINDGNGDIFTSNDPVEIASGFTIVTGVAADTAFTLTAGLTGGSDSTATANVDIRSGADPVSFEETVLADDPLAFYRFEESSDSAILLLDSSPNDNDSLSLTSEDLATQQPGAIGQSWAFDSASIELPVNLDPSTGSFSIALLAKLDSAGPGSTNSLVSQQNIGGTGRSLLQKSFLDGSYSSFLGGQGRQDFNSLPPSDIWCHLVLVYDQASQELRFYENGALVATETGIVAETTSGNYILGANKGQDTEFLAGQLDELAIFDFALDDPNDDADLSDSRVGVHYAAFLQDANPLLGFAGDVTIALGDSTDLTWKVGDTATSITIDNGVGDVTSATTSNQGNISVSPTQTTTYTLTVNGSETQSVTVEVFGRPEIVDCGFNDEGNFFAECINLVEGRSYVLAISEDLETFNPITGTQTADASGVLTFIDTPDIIEGTEPSLFYRVEEAAE